MTQQYDYDTLPEEFPNYDAIPEELFGLGFEAIKQAIESGNSIAHNVKAVYVYERKGHMSYDQLGGKRNASYGSEADDVVLTLTVRVPNPKHVVNLDTLQKLETEVKEHAVRAKREALESEIEATSHELTELARKASEKRRELEELTKK